VTVIATTNKNLSEAVEKGEFRKDLFYRLHAVSLNVPSLREKDRKEDIPVLARHFLASFATEYNKKMEGFSTEAEDLMMSYHWPGNVRELKNVIQGIVVLQNTRIILPEHLPLEISHRPHSNAREDQGEFILPEEGISLDDFEKGLILQAMERTENNKTRAAKLLGMSYDSFRYQLKKFGLDS
jgi:DNA-binding NtrC family response regulator